MLTSQTSGFTKPACSESSKNMFCMKSVLGSLANNRDTYILLRCPRRFKSCFFYSVDENNNADEGEPEFTSMINIRNPLGLDGISDDEEGKDSSEIGTGSKRAHDADEDEALELKKPKFEHYRRNSFESPGFA